MIELKPVKENFLRAACCGRGMRVLATLSLFVICTGTLPADDSEQQADGADFFRGKVLPILRDACFECHSHEFEEASGQLMLDSRAAILLGGTRGPAVDSQNRPEKSWLFRAMTYKEGDLQMPPDGKLPDSSIAIIREWISRGTPVSAEYRGKQRNSSAPKSQVPHWAYQPLPKDASELGKSIDSVLKESLDAAGLDRSPRADRRTLLLRLHFDLTGLPPSAEQVQAIVSDTRSDEIVLQEASDALLTSPNFGERWARHWMDVARYADNKGYVFREDREYSQAYRYRDWLIHAFNNDMGYDEFVRQQLAADLLTENDENLPALGFLTLGRRFLNNQFDIIDDRLDVMSRGLMGMTLACARCHDHKYDPISQKDYYSLAGVFFNTQEAGEGAWMHGLQDREKMRPSFVLLRGKPGSVGERVPRRFVRFLSEKSPDFPEDTSGRLELADHILAPENPLTARVIANRVWMHLMGASLVVSPSDLGTRCPPPRQQRLLDFLALRLRENSWSIKSLVRDIVQSETYRQESTSRAAGQLDPENELYWRMNRRRADWEYMRDALLSRTGRLDNRILGKSEKLEAAPYMFRRTVYAYIDRQNLPGVFRTFDIASPDTHSPRRAQTTVPQQGLFMLNSPFVMQQAEYLAARAQSVAKDRGKEQAIDWTFRAILARDASEHELEWFSNFLAAEATETSKRLWVQACQVLLASNELIFID